MLVIELVAVAGHRPQRGAKAGGTIPGKAHEARLLVERPADGLTDPEGGVRGELEALAPVELVDGVLEAEVALLDEIEQLHAGRHRVAAGDAHDQAEVGADEPVLWRCRLAYRLAQVTGSFTRVEVRLRLAAALDDLRQLALFLSSEQRHQADLVQVLTDRITHDRCLNGSNWAVIPAFP